MPQEVGVAEGVHLPALQCLLAWPVQRDAVRGRPLPCSQRAECASPRAQSLKRMLRAEPAAKRVKRVIREGFLQRAAQVGPIHAADWAEQQFAAASKEGVFEGVSHDITLPDIEPPASHGLDTPMAEEGAGQMGAGHAAGMSMLREEAEWTEWWAAKWLTPQRHVEDCLGR